MDPHPHLHTVFSLGKGVWFFKLYFYSSLSVQMPHLIVNLHRVSLSNSWTEDPCLRPTVIAKVLTKIQR